MRILTIAIVFFSLITSFNIKAIEVFNCTSDDCKQQFKQYKKFAKNGSPEAQEILANLFLNGYGVEKNPSQAAKWFKRSAKQGRTGAKASLAFLYIKGQGREQDVERGIKMLKSLSDKNIHQASLQLGVLFAEGVWLEQNYQLAKQWLSLAISQGNQRAILLLGMIYQYGLTGEVKLADAKMLFQHIAENDDQAAAQLLIVEQQESSNVSALTKTQKSQFFQPKEQLEKSIERIEVINNIDTFLVDNLNFIKGQGIYTSSSTGSRLKGKRCTDNVNCKAAINAQDKFNIMNFWNGLNTVNFHVNTGGMQ